MVTQYQNDWEDPRLSVSGFVTDYIIWRLAIDEIEWLGVPTMITDTGVEHDGMRKICEMTEVQSAGEWCNIAFSLFFPNLHPSEMEYSYLIFAISFAGAKSVEQAKKGKWIEVEWIRSYTSHYIYAGIRASWETTNQSWAGFMRYCRLAVCRLAFHATSERENISEEAAHANRHAQLA
ncbi:hypothetical protein PRIPAC_92287 [Pristionchus pacificus]|uniref:Uncharacterized protein n=1 Tax=Pristionchus pacificus TaxID=54126 RepID=A0A2A6BQM7_PRIPA|nr:hypothetical protein PRIPAC_92287 [Pristionchus pacificus]|eukprot:PDM68252.1 hypothetical protein PRIPAC_46296 [Pristionchus pacificus]